MALIYKNYLISFYCEVLDCYKSNNQFVSLCADIHKT